ncbi:MAG: hypothetical protein P8L46_04490 [Acidimicrobiales bacterium]|nr:hypothetical protein [Acidimicrobiales bacterium]
MVLRILVGAMGAMMALATMGSAIRTVVVPRAEQVWISRAVFRVLRSVMHRGSEAAKARFAPTALLVLPLVWSIGVLLGCSATFWALGVEPYRNAFVLSGSSLTTLGFRTTSDLPTLFLAILEGLVGLGLVALLISFLPTMYSAFSRREIAVAKLHLRSTWSDGTVSPASLLVRNQRIAGLDQLSEMWGEWEDWFVEVEETHTSFPMLVFFRSPVPDRSWIVSAGIALDTASLYQSTLDLRRSPRAALMIRTGSLALRRIADFFGFVYPSDPQSGDQISITRAEFDDVCNWLSNEGLPLRADRDQAWRDFAGWRVNYDVVLLQLADFVDAPAAPWISDRTVS